MSCAFSLGQTLPHWIAACGPWALGLVAASIFAATGLVVAPFLPGDSLRFLTGTLLAASSHDVQAAVVVLSLAAILGDALKSTIGRHAAPPVLSRLGGHWLRRSHLAAARRYFVARFGPSTIVIARFATMVRTLAPLLAGAGAIDYGRFARFNVAGACVWVIPPVDAGVGRGAVPLVDQHLSLFTRRLVALTPIPLATSALRVLQARQLPGATAAPSCAEAD